MNLWNYSSTTVPFSFRQCSSHQFLWCVCVPYCSQGWTRSWVGGVLPLPKGVEIPVPLSSTRGRSSVETLPWRFVGDPNAHRRMRSTHLEPLSSRVEAIPSEAHTCATTLPSSSPEKKLPRTTPRLPRFFLFTCSFRSFSPVPFDWEGSQEPSYQSTWWSSTVVVWIGATDVATPTKRETRAHHNKTCRHATTVPSRSSRRTDTCACTRRRIRIQVDTQLDV